MLLDELADLLGVQLFHLNSAFGITSRNPIVAGFGLALKTRTGTAKRQ